MQRRLLHIGCYLLIASMITWYLFISSISSDTLAQAAPIDAIIKASNMEIKQVPGMEIAFPHRALPNEKQDITDLTYWLDTLPHSEDKTAAWYVVYPKVGVTIPLVWPTNDDVEKIQVGDVFDHYKYLEAGALHYVGNAPDQGIGNMVLAVHSSFAKNDPGRYKTAGQVAPLTDVGDKIFVYLADEQGKYTLYVYTVEQSKEIPETQVSILDQNVAKETITLFSCYPIGTTDARWVNQWVLTETLSAEQRIKSSPIAEVTEKVAFTTQSVVKPTSVKKVSKKVTATKQQEHASAPTDEDTAITAIKPTFKERVTYRPVVYRTAMKLVSTVWFKRANLQKLIDLIDKRIETLSPEGSPSENNKKLIVIFMLIQELIEGFMG